MHITGRSAQWCFWISKFDFEVVHRLGTKQQTADKLLQLATNGKNKRSRKDHVPLLVTGTQHFKDTTTIHSSVAFQQSFQPRTLTEFLREQASNTYCHKSHFQVVNTNFDLTSTTSAFYSDTHEPMIHYKSWYHHRFVNLSWCYHTI